MIWKLNKHSSSANSVTRRLREEIQWLYNHKSPILEKKANMGVDNATWQIAHIGQDTSVTQVMFSKKSSTCYVHFKFMPVPPSPFNVFRVFYLFVIRKFIWSKDNVGNFGTCWWLQEAFSHSNLVLANDLYSANSGIKWWWKPELGAEQNSVLFLDVLLHKAHFLELKVSMGSIEIEVKQWQKRRQTKPNSNWVGMERWEHTRSETSLPDYFCTTATMKYWTLLNTANNIGGANWICW